MQTAHDYKRYAVLYVDDEEMALKYFQKTFGAEFRVLTAINAAEGLKLIEEMGEEIGVLLTDQRMPGQKGVQLLERARQLRPKMVRMMITAYADFGVSVDAINLGNIFRYISKPLQVEDQRHFARAEDGRAGDAAQPLQQRAKWLDHDLLFAEQVVNQQTDARLAGVDHHDVLPA